MEVGQLRFITLGENVALWLLTEARPVTSTWA